MSKLTLSSIKNFVYLLGVLTIYSSYGQHSIQLELVSSYHTGLFDESAAEISAYDAETMRLFVTNGGLKTVDIYDLSSGSILPYSTIDITVFGGGANSVSIKDGIVAVAVENNNKQDPGFAVFFDVDGNYINQVTAGALPDMITFTPNGKYVLLANEGEPNDDFTIDPEGSVTIIDIRGGVENINQSDAIQIGFTAFNNAILDESIRVSANPGNSTVAQDLEPEYISVSRNSRYAWVALQENNAVAIIDVRRGKILDLVGLGFKDHSLQGNGFDASNRSEGIDIRSWPVKGMYMPDAIANYRRWGRELVVMVNEGDSRDYSGYSEETRVEDLALDPLAFPNAAELQAETALGRLKTTIATGDADGDGLFEEIYAYGARSFSIRRANGSLIYDSGDELEQLTAQLLPEDFNSTNDENNSFKDRSDDKGPEPEAVEIARIRGRHYAFIGLERIGGIAVYDISNPYHPTFVQYINNRNFDVDAQSIEAGDLGPEDILYIKKRNSPTGSRAIVVANEVSGSISLFNVKVKRHYYYYDEEPATSNEPTEVLEEELADELVTSNFLVYPNPIEDGILRLNEPRDIFIYNLEGKEVLSSVEKQEVDVSSLDAGLYVLKTGEGASIRIQIK
ncbi:MAG: choice-of-anchor I family protein [Ekhidna sp.]